MLEMNLHRADEDESTERHPPVFGVTRAAARPLAPAVACDRSGEMKLSEGECGSARRALEIEHFAATIGNDRAVDEDGLVHHPIDYLIEPGANGRSQFEQHVGTRRDRSTALRSLA